MEVIVRIIKTNPWAGLTKWKNCWEYIGSYLTRTGNVYTGLTLEDARRLEKAMGKPEGALNPTQPGGAPSFWDTFAVKLDANDLILHLDRPEDELQYLFLKNHRRVANGLSEIDPSKDYLLLNANTEAEEINKRSKTKRDAYKVLDKMSTEDMRKCLRLYGVKSDNISNELAESKVNELIEKDPAKFIRKWVNNPNKEIEFLIEEAVAKNVLRKNRTQYYYGTDLLGNGIDDVIAYLKDSQNQEIKMGILQEIKSK